MRIIRSPEEFRAACNASRRAGRSVGLVPTMGALHAGHLALLQKAHQHADAVAVSIFVNPTQFGPGEDLDKYPRNLDADLEQCAAAGVELVFVPAASDMYAQGEQTRVTTGELAARLCGASRAGHFSGVCTVVSKLFNLAGPCSAVFGRKDYQQLKIIERMVSDLFWPVGLVAHPIVREADGLAMSSRNRYLEGHDRNAALGISFGLNAARAEFEHGERQAAQLEEVCAEQVERAGLRVDYVSVVDENELTGFGDGKPVPDRVLLAVAAFAGGTRLIDNMLLGEDSEISPS